MKIKGFQKVTLIDYPGKIACTVFLFGCDFRCGFCHNPGLVLGDSSGQVLEEFSKQEILDFLRERKGYLEGVCFTGGEPLLTLEKEFVREIKSLGYLVKLDTNGSFPDKLRAFLGEGLVDYVAMDVKTVPEEYQKVTNSKIDVGRIEDSIKLISSYFIDYEFRTTIVNGLHDVEKMRSVGEWMKELTGKKLKRFSLQGFKHEAELLDNEFQNVKNTSEETLNELKEVLKDFFEEIEVRV